MPCVITPDNSAAQQWGHRGVEVADIEIVWDGKDARDYPPVKIMSKEVGISDDYANRVMGMVAQRGYRDLIKLRFKFWER